MTFKMHSEGEGREDLRPFIASRKSAGVPWDNSDIGIGLARKRFQAGTHTMATHRDGNTLFLCSIPLKRKPVPQPGYFILIKDWSNGKVAA